MPTRNLITKNPKSTAIEELLRSPDRPPAHIIRVIEGFKTVVFHSKFDSWPQTTDIAISEDGRGKVAGNTAC
ncbi:uncharacterized protein A4U43_C02F12040 [Asparagus officinalis]|uniref:Uncharacterized protein n=1 Tax=Asparagus officinalis TaxID=4686 RepID=A0A5P1FHU2_ASPOF|nr:uncharacterized protein A4U43_C02F12040 [Asparagus officinalis]